MTINDLIADIGKQRQLQQDILESLKKHGQNPDESARVAFSLIELGINAFRRSGMGPFLVMALCQMIAHGATTERTLKALMLIQEEDDLMDQVPGVKEQRQARDRSVTFDDEDESAEAVAGGKKRRVM